MVDQDFFGKTLPLLSAKRIVLRPPRAQDAQHVLDIFGDPTAMRFEVMKVHRIEADIDPRNLASARLLEHLGFQEEGLLKERWFTYGEWSDSALYGLVRSQS